MKERAGDDRLLRRATSANSGDPSGPPIGLHHTPLQRLISNDLVVSLVGSHLVQNGAEVVDLRRLQRRELLVRFEFVLPQLLADRQHVPVVNVSGGRRAERAAYPGG